jgi:hypothetical protein
MRRWNAPPLSPTPKQAAFRIFVLQASFFSSFPVRFGEFKLDTGCKCFSKFSFIVLQSDEQFCVWNVVCFHQYSCSTLVPIVKMLHVLRELQDYLGYEEISLEEINKSGVVCV